MTVTSAFEAACRRALWNGLIVAVPAMLSTLSTTVAAHADSPAAAIQWLDVDPMQPAPVGVRNDCWESAPAGASVYCASRQPEHGGLLIGVSVAHASSTDIVVAYESMDLTATGGVDYVALNGSVTIMAGDLRSSFDIDFIDDLDEEGNEEFVVKATAPEDVNLVHDHIHVTIVDEESIKVSVVDDSEVEGHAGGMPVLVLLSDPVWWPVRVRVETSAGTAGPSDYQAIDELTRWIDPGSAHLHGFSFRHRLLDDSLDEPDETYTLTVSGNDYLGMDADSGTMTIIDDDSEPVVGLTHDVGGIEDVVRTLWFPVRLDPPSGREVTVDYATADGTATAGSDYTETHGTLTFAAGETRKTIDVPVLEDGFPEEDETFTVTLSDATNASIGSGTATGRIEDDDPVPASLSIGDVSAAESSEAMEFPVTLTGDRAEMATVTVDYATADRTAEAGNDYTETTGTLTFATDVTRQTIRVPLLDDAIDETDETFVARLSNATGAGIGDASGDGKILDDDATSSSIALSAQPPRVSEGDGATPVGVTATLDAGARTEATLVTVTVSGSGDPDAVDFADVRDFTITIAPGGTSGTGTFTVTPEDDEVDEQDEVLDIAGTSDLAVTPTSVTLADDEQTSTEILLSAVPSTVSEGAGATAVEVTATLDAGARTVATMVTVSVAGSGDPDAVDFADLQDFTITIAEGTTRGRETFTLTPVDDNVAESSETLTLDGTSDLPVKETSVTITDDDVASDGIALSASPVLVAEDGGAVPVRVTASLNGAERQAPTTVTVSVDGSGNARAVDFQAVRDFAIIIAANAANGTGTFTLTPEDDRTVEADETLTVSGMSDLPVTPTAVTLADDDEASGRILLSVAPARVSEGDGPVSVTVTASLDRGLRQEATTVTVSVAGGGDPDAADFDPVADFDITIAANAASGTGTFTLTPEDDAEDEADAVLALTGVSDLPVAPASMVLADDDETPRRVLSVADAQAAEGAGEMLFAVTLDGSAAAEVTVGYATADPAGSAGPVAEAGIDYAGAAGTLTFAPGEVARTIRVAVVDDAVDEPDETFALVLSDLRGAMLDRGSALGTIRDDDVPPTLSVAGASGAEDVDELAFAVTLGTRSLAAVTVEYATADGTATAGADYEAGGGTLTFSPGGTAKTIRVPVIDDALDEADEEFFTVTLSAPTGATLDAGSATGAIRDDDEPPSLSVADAAGDETVGALDFAVTLSAASGIGVSFSYATADGTATAGSDYAMASGTLALAPGETSATIRVAVIDDAVDEADEETFALTLSALQNAAAADVSATGTIRDDDLSPPTVAGGLPAAMLCVGGAVYEVDLAGYFDGAELAFSVVSSAPRVATAALAGSRLTVAPAAAGEASVTVTATNPAGSASGTVTVRVVTDPAELDAVEATLASIGRGILTGVAGSVRGRFDPGNAARERSASTHAGGAGTHEVPDAGIARHRWSGPMGGARSVGWSGRELPESGIRGGRPGTTPRRGAVPLSFSFDSTPAGPTVPAWSVWARGDTQRFESGTDQTSHDGTLAAVHLGADARFGEWLAGVSVASTSAEADYRFARSVDACGGGGTGEGRVDAGLTSVHPYAGRRVGRGWVWAALGAGRGEASVERCGTGRRDEADLSMRLAALGGRHPFAGGERLEVSVVEEIGVLELTTGDAPGPVGDRAVSVGQARLGLEAAGVAAADRAGSLTAFVRAFARGDWGDGATGTGLELAAGLRYRNPPRRLGIDIGFRGLAVHSAEDAAEHGADLAFSILPRADGTGLQGSLTWRRETGGLLPGALDGVSPWTAPAAGPPDAERHWIARTRLGYGIARTGLGRHARHRHAVRGTRCRALRPRRRATRRPPHVRRPRAWTRGRVGNRTQRSCERGKRHSCESPRPVLKRS